MKKKSILITLVLIISVFAFSLVQHFQQKAYNHVNNKEISTQKEEVKNIAKEPSAEGKTNSDNDINTNTSNIKDNKNTKENVDTKHNNTNENIPKKDETKSDTGGSSKSNIKQSNSSVNLSDKEPEASSSNKKDTNIGKNNLKPEVKEANIIIRNEVTGETIASTYIEVEGLNAGDATIEALSENGIAYRTVRSSAGIYFSSIAGFKEKSAGPSSGWCYYVNGKKPGMGASGYILKKSDKVEWRFLENGL